MTQNILEQAKQGNPNAIAALMSRSMKSQGIDVQASLEDGCLQVYLEAAKVPSPQATVAFIRKGMANLDIASIDRVKVYARQQGEPIPAWQEDIVLREPPAPPPPIPALDWDDHDDFGGSSTAADENLLAGEDLFERTLLPTSRIDDSMVDESLYVETDEDDDLGDLPDEMTEFTPDEEEEMLRGTLDGDLDDLDELEESPELEEDAPPADADAESKPKRSALPLLLILLAAIGLGGFYLFNQQPQLLSSIPGLGGLFPAPPDASTPTSGKTAAKPDAAQMDSSKTTAKPPDAKSETDAEKSDAEKSDAEKSDAEKSDAEKSDAEKSDAEKADTEKADTEKADTEKADTEKADAEKSDTEKADAEAGADAEANSETDTKEATTDSSQPDNKDGSVEDTAQSETSGSATNDPFRDAVNKAMSASELTQTAATPEDWNEVAAKWQAAIELMKSVPKSSPHYDLAQKKAAEEYPKNLTYAQQRAEQ
jgi:hypothetical protein